MAGNEHIVLAAQDVARDKTTGLPTLILTRAGEEPQRFVMTPKAARVAAQLLVVAADAHDAEMRERRLPKLQTHVYVVYKAPAGPVGLRVFSGLGQAEAFADAASKVEKFYSDESTTADIALARKLAVPMVRCWRQAESATMAPTG